MPTITQTEQAVTERLLAYQEKRGTPNTHFHKALDMAHTTWDARIRGERSFTIRELIVVADVLGVTLADLVCGTDPVA